MENSKMYSPTASRTLAEAAAAAYSPAAADDGFHAPTTTASSSSHLRINIEYEEPRKPENPLRWKTVKPPDFGRRDVS